ncbi:THAP-type domain-containing protein [Aphis craccivora]|uniref:THAP-type domain-containing protein n=1 Tax=Aphis craccivora TaxID=307492 RepID=A0A6G0ZPF3_APHCR|nr:THAP-type domain-containing protein [Aphis craccivora]
MHDAIELFFIKTEYIADIGYMIQMCMIIHTCRKVFSIKITDEYFQSVVSDKQQYCCLRSKNIDTKIIIWVQNTLPLLSTLSPESIDSGRQKTKAP